MIEARAIVFEVGRLRVEERSKGKWAVTDNATQVLNDKRQWEYEPRPSSRDDDFIARTRFDFDTAVALAREVQDERPAAR